MKYDRKNSDNLEDDDLTEQVDYSEHAEVIQLLLAAQDVEWDMREKAREAHLFVSAREGQWEPYWWNENSGKPRYTFDITSPVIDQISGEMELADFDIKVSPGNGDADEDVAKTYDGMIRNIEAISGAINIFNAAGRSMVTCGIDGWRVDTDYIEDDSFDMDLLIKPIPNFDSRVFFDPAAELQDKSDARFCFVLQTMAKDIYEKRWPEGSMRSLSNRQQGQAFYFQPDVIMVGEFFCKKEEEREIVLMSNNHVYEDDDKFQSVKDDLERIGVTEVKRRTRKVNKVYRRLLDSGGWLEEESLTVFQWIPVIPTYGNFKILENKSIYHGAVEKLIDPQRVYNYSMSREIEEGALSPRAKYWMTRQQAVGESETLATLNTNAEPVQFFTPDPNFPQVPQQQGGAQINPGLRTISEATRNMVGQISGLFEPSMGDNPRAQSGVAIRQLQNKGDTSTHKYFESQEIAIQHTARILVDAIPAVYGDSRSVRILKEDGGQEMVTVNEEVMDFNDQGEQVGIVKLQDLSKGIYDVTCSAGPSFQNRQEETVSAMIEMAQADPSIIELGGDILLQNISTPGMSLLAERKREALFKAGLIPIPQMTDEEKEKAVKKFKEAQGGQQKDPAMVLAEAEQKKGEADLQSVQAGIQTSQGKLMLERMSLQLKAQEQQLAGQRQQMDAQERQIKQAVELMNARSNAAKVQSEIQKNEASILKFGAETQGKMLDNEEQRIELEELRGMSVDDLAMIAYSEPMVADGQG